MSESQWVAHVFPNSEWDYKNNKNTIFGVVWDYDIANSQSGHNTEFDTEERDYDDAAQFGNFNAGYTGTYAGVSSRNQYIFAGLGEIEKRRSAVDMTVRSLQIALWVAPYGDEEIDYKWNTRGMQAARRKE
jgi:hypothetical protein